MKRLLQMMPSSSRRRIIRGRQIVIQPWNRNDGGIIISTRSMIGFFSNLGVIVTLLLVFVPHHGHSFQITTNNIYHCYGNGRAGGRVPRSNNAAFMTTTDTETLSSHSHDVDTNFNNGDGSSSSSSNNNISNTSDPSFPIKTAASDIIDLVNDAAASATASSSSSSTSEVATILQIGTSNHEIIADYNNGDIDETPFPSSSSSSSAKEVALDILALEDDATAAATSAAATSAASSFGGGDGNITRGGGGSNNEGLPFAPMMTYQKYLTMQVRSLSLSLSRVCQLLMSYYYYSK